MDAPKDVRYDRQVRYAGFCLPLASYVALPRMRWCRLELQARREIIVLTTRHKINHCESVYHLQPSATTRRVKIPPLGSGRHMRAWAGKGRRFCHFGVSFPRGVVRRRNSEGPQDYLGIAYWEHCKAEIDAKQALWTAVWDCTRDAFDSKARSMQFLELCITTIENFSRPRIWGDQGQANMESARVCLLNAGPTGSEALKNLVLGGIGSFTVVDAARVEPSDLGNNFFVTANDLGAPRAAVVCALLQELNTHVMGSFVEESPEQLIDSRPSFFAEVTVVIATQLPEGVVVKLDRVCRQHDVPLVVVRSYGLLGMVRLSMEERCLIEAKLEHPPEDLRLHCPWPALEEHARSYDLDSLDAMHHKHVPYAVLLLHALFRWREQHPGRDIPATREEKTAFKAVVKGLKRFDDEENIAEAITNAYRVWSPPALDPELQALLAAPIPTLSKDSKPFYIMLAALKEFMQAEGGSLPLEGSIPDMTSLTEYYLNLHKVYHEKATADVASVDDRVRALLQGLGYSDKTTDVVSPDMVRLFCKNARSLQVTAFPTLEDEYAPSRGHVETVTRLLNADESSRNTALYLLMRAVDRIRASRDCYPGTFDSEIEEDHGHLKTALASVLSEYGLSSLPGAAGAQEELVGEVCRFGAAELHVVAAVMGGIASQEVIKILTNQFSVIRGCLVYNAMDSTTTIIYA
eukprot:jgi/Mesvir1/9404/Mv01508-RA.1